MVNLLRLYSLSKHCRKRTAQISAISLNERLGSSYSMLGDFEEAVPYLEAAVKEEQTDDRLFQLAFTYLQLHENQKAITLSSN